MTFKERLFISIMGGGSARTAFIDPDAAAMRTREGTEVFCAVFGHDEISSVDGEGVTHMLCCRCDQEVEPA